jgi:alkylhydroperoxidase family enzyme
MAALARKAFEAPALLVPADLDPLRALVGDDAMDLAFVLAGFHFINRIADLLGVAPEALPESLRRFEWIRGLYIRVFSRLMAMMDMTNRTYEGDFEQTVERFADVFEAAGVDAARQLQPLAACPRLVEVVAQALAERDRPGGLDREVLVRVHAEVARALPRQAEDARGLHARPSDPVEAFAFVGTRYAYRTTEASIEALRAAGWDDAGILALAVAVADANQWARIWRLLGLDPAIFDLSADR